MQAIFAEPTVWIDIRNGNPVDLASLEDPTPKISADGRAKEIYTYKKP